MLQVSSNGEDFIKQYEGFSLIAYKPLPTDKWTIGWGSTAGVYEGMQITEDQAEDMFQDDLYTPQQTINHYVIYSLNQNQFDALVSLVFNIGSGAFINSHALTMLNNGNIDGFCKASFSREFGWCHSGGHMVEGLVNRRQAEMNLFLS